MKSMRKTQMARLVAGVVTAAMVACFTGTAAAAAASNGQHLHPIAPPSTWAPIEIGQVETGVDVYTGACGAVNRVFVGTVVTDLPTPKLKKRRGASAPWLIVIRLDGAQTEYLGFWTSPRRTRFWPDERLVVIEPPAGCGQAVIAWAGGGDAEILGVPDAVAGPAYEK